ncbi:UDP-N-acetylglucosamine 4,6-dehydratase family protein [Aquimarina longa]|uniref:UDP-N-acetylglucosamine 4,6-dehydratase family protein n=1 Tax=Aquimarina longa TaxID=1080221 RepID=UPI000AF711D1
MENQNISKELHDKVIMITGAAGSIGSEIVRQASYFNYKHLVLVDQSESPLYDLQQELLSKGVSNFTPIVADIRDRQRLEIIFQEYRPNMVFHAAAYKHVPLMESNPYEAIKINVLGTRKLADLSSEYGVDKFVFVSTDKAVNPTNVMGATKRVAEMYIKCVNKTSETKFITTRFGNVLGSNGSVIPLFKKQIEKGGPLTVTHRDVTRFFMTIPEASQLVIEAGTMGDGGEIFIFDMGESVKIFDLAKKMIRLSGLKYPDDIDIQISGLRPGEKLYEELLADTENTLPTYHKKIMISKFDDNDCEMIKDKINDLCIMNLFNQDHQIVGKLKEIVPEFISNNSTFESIDKINKKSIRNKKKILA